MPEGKITEVLSGRLPLCAYLSPLWRGRRVLEVGCGGGASADFMMSQGASRVVSVDSDAAAIESARGRFHRANLEFRAITDLRQAALLSDRFDVVLVPDGRALLGDADLIPVFRRLLAESGTFVIAVPSADRKPPSAPGGVGYYQLSDALSRHFPSVRMFGQTPFMGFGLVEFDGGAEAMRIDASLVEGGAEPPSHYIAAAGNAPPAGLGYALVQVPFGPVETAVRAADGVKPGPGERPARDVTPPPVLSGAKPDAATSKALQDSQSAQSAQAARIRELNTDIARLNGELERLRQVERSRASDGGASDTRLQAAERRADESEQRLAEAERRARARLDEAEQRATELRRKLDDAVVQGESSMRIARAQGDEMEELRARLRRAAEDRSAADAELAKLRRALAEADESVLTLTRRTAEEMAAVAQRIAIGLRAPVEDKDARERMAELATLRDEAERLRGRVTDAEARAAASEKRLDELSRAPRPTTGADDGKLRAAREELAGRDERIARLEGERQDLIWRVAELEEKLRHAETSLSERRPGSSELSTALAARDRAIEEFHRAAAAHVNEVNRLQSTVGEQSALVAELEDAAAELEERATTAEKEVAGLRRNAKELEEADRARRGRLAELEGKLLRLEREKAAGGGAASVDGGAVLELSQRLQSLEQMALAAEQRALGAHERANAAEARLALAEERVNTAEEARAQALADARELTERLDRATRTAAESEQGIWRAREEISAREERIAVLERELAGMRGRLELVPPPPASEPPAEKRNGTHAMPPPAEMLESVRDIERQLQNEMRVLGVIEETLTRARDEVSRMAAAGDATEWERILGAKDTQLIEGRLELARVRREAEAREIRLSQEIADLRARLDPNADTGDDRGMQLILMHTTLQNIRRRAARLHDELERYRRRLDSLPPGALSSLLEEIGDDLAEFAK